MCDRQLLLLNSNYTSKYLLHTVKLLAAKRMNKERLATAAKSQA